MTTPTDQPTAPTTAPTTRWGVLATGGIAATVSRDIALVEGAELAAVASRDAGRAAAFAAEHGFARSHGSYAALLADPGVDAVYVATPHAQHVALARAAVRAGKAVLVEKPVGCTLAATAALADLARERGTFVMEAMWTRFQPNVVALRELLAAGAVGEVRTVHADFGFRMDLADTGHRLLDPAQGGGALLDLGVYPVALAQMLLGAPSSVAATGALGTTGVDVEAALVLGWPGGQQALLTASLATAPASGAVVVGTAGRVELEGPFFRTPRLLVHRSGSEQAEVVEHPVTGAGYTHMVAHVQECLARGLTESPVMPLADTVAVAAVLDQALDQLGAVHRDDPTPPEAP